MKKIIFFLTVMALNPAWGSMVTIQDGIYNDETKAIELDVQYSGGCKEHTFHLEIGSCAESYPVQCNNIQLIDETEGDHCRAILNKKVILTLKDTGLNNGYYNGASLVIHGSDGSNVRITLPFNK